MGLVREIEKTAFEEQMKAAEDEGRALRTDEKRPEERLSPLSARRRGKTSGEKDAVVLLTETK